MNDLSDELMEFLNYVEHSNDETAEGSKGTLVKNIHEKVVKVKNDVNVEVEFMTLLERDREKLEEGRIEGIKEAISKLLSKGKSESEIADLLEISIEIVNEVKKNGNKINR
ncbi:MAG: hypothetical protein RR844_04055 [Clostridium sp.]